MVRPLVDLRILNTIEIVYYLQIVAISVLESVEGLSIAIVLRIVVLDAILYPRALRVLA